MATTMRSSGTNPAMGEDVPRLVVATPLTKLESQILAFTWDQNIGPKAQLSTLRHNNQHSIQSLYET